jgi:hypothetical protein
MYCKHLAILILTHQILDHSEERPELVEEVVSQDEVERLDLRQVFAVGQRIGQGHELHLDAHAGFQDGETTDLKREMGFE